MMQVSEALSLLANTTALVEQGLHLPAKSCAVITNGRLVWVFNPTDPKDPPPGQTTPDICGSKYVSIIPQPFNALISRIGLLVREVPITVAVLLIQTACHVQRCVQQFQSYRSSHVGKSVCCCVSVLAALIAEDFGLLQLYAESFQAGGTLATFLKGHRAASKKKAKADGDTAEPPMTAAEASTVVMVTASALAAQVYPDSRFGSLHAKQLTGKRKHGGNSKEGVRVGCWCIHCGLLLPQLVWRLVGAESQYTTLSVADMHLTTIHLWPQHTRYLLQHLCNYACCNSEGKSIINGTAGPMH